MAEDTAINVSTETTDTPEVIETSVPAEPTLIEKLDFSDPVLYWPANETLGMPEFELVIPYRTTGRIEVYKIPPCDAWPTGYWFALNTDTRWSQGIEPGCASWEKTMLARVLVHDPVNSDGTVTADKHVQNVIEYIHPALADTVDLERLNPPLPTAEDIEEAQKSLYTKLKEKWYTEQGLEADAELTEEQATAMNEYIRSNTPIYIPDAGYSNTPEIITKLTEIWKLEYCIDEGEELTAEEEAKLEEYLNTHTLPTSTPVSPDTPEEPTITEGN